MTESAETSKGFQLRADDCTLRLRPDVTLVEAHCTIEADGSKFLVFTGEIGGKPVATRVKYGDWNYNSATHELELRGGPAAAEQLITAMLASSSVDDVDESPVASTTVDGPVAA